MLIEKYILISSQTTRWVGVFTNDRRNRVLLFPGMTERTSQVLEEWLWGPFGETGLHVCEHQAEQITEPRQFDFLSLRVIGERGLHKVCFGTQKA